MTKMYIIYDEIELFDFFEREPISVGDEEAGDYIYTYYDNDFKLIIFISTYEKYVNISITYNENIVFKSNYSDVIKIEEMEHGTLKIILKDGTKILLKKTPQIGIIVEN